MVDQGFNEIILTIVRAAISILSVLIPIIAGYLVSILKNKKIALVNKIGADQFNYTLEVARSVYNAIEQRYKGAEGSVKANNFDNMLVQKFPGLTEDELEHFREAVVGEIKAKTSELCKPINTDTFNRMADQIEYPEFRSGYAQVEPLEGYTFTTTTTSEEVPQTISATEVTVKPKRKTKAEIVPESETTPIE